MRTIGSPRHAIVRFDDLAFHFIHQTKEIGPSAQQLEISVRFALPKCPMSLIALFEIPRIGVFGRVNYCAIAFCPASAEFRTLADVSC